MFQNFPLWRLTWFGHQAAEAMRYLEKQNVIHRDLSARNCLYV